MKTRKYIIPIIILIMLFGCTESKTQTLNFNSDSLLNKTELVNIELTTWDRSEYLLIGTDSNWVKENIINKKEELWISNKSYLSKDALNYIVKFVLEHSSDQYTSLKIDHQVAALIVHLYGTNGEMIGFVFQKEKSRNYIDQFIRRLRVAPYSKEYDEVISQLVKYDSILGQ